MARHPESAAVRGALIALVVFVFTTLVATALVVFAIHPPKTSSSSSPAKPVSIASMSIDELLANLGEDAIGPIDCAKGLQAAGIDTQGQVLTGLIWQQSDRLVVVCAPS